MQMYQSKLKQALRAMTLAAVAAGCSFAASAQQTSASSSSTPTLNLQLPAAAESSFSSSSADNAVVVADNHFDFVNVNEVAQPARRGYGRPRYRGANTNADGSNKYVVFAGAGFTQPVGNTWHYFTPSFGIQAGVGRQFNQHFAVPIEYDYDYFGLTGQTLANQLTLYNNQINYFCSMNDCVADGVTTLGSLDGNAHVWSFSIDPTYTYYAGPKMGAYALVGVGFYHKVTNFETPETGYGEDYYGDVYSYTANQVIDHYTSNAPGFSAGIGFTYKLSHFSNERLYAEGKYVFIPNSQRQGITVASPVNATTVAETNEFPANSNRTSYFPVKFGIRF